MIDAILSFLAVWRLSNLVVNEDGPFAIFSRLRYKSGIRTIPMRTEDGQIESVKVAKNTLAQGLTCLWCVSVWFAIFFGLFGKTRAGKSIRDIFGISGGAILVQESIEWLRSK